MLSIISTIPVTHIVHSAGDLITPPCATLRDLPNIQAVEAGYVR